MDFDIYGSRWEKDRKYYKYLKKNIKNSLKYKDTPKIISKYKINLGLLSSGNDDDITRRCVEIPASGSLLCCQRTNTLKKIFKENKEALFFSTPEECFLKCKNILQKPKLLKKKLPTCYTLFNFSDEMIEGYGMGSAQLKERKCLFDVR